MWGQLTWQHSLAPLSCRFRLGGILVFLGLFSWNHGFQEAKASTIDTCKSGLKCENGGVCQDKPDGHDFCRCLPPASALEPKFYVGARCHIPAVMCADTSTFYCAYGSQCAEIVQGENYTCEGCNSAVAGPHCDAEGVPCGRVGLMCFNGGTCSPEATCICPGQWSGNENCTAPAPGSGLEGDTWQDEEQTWYVPLLGALGALIMLTILGLLIYFCYPKQSSTALAREKDSEETLRLQEHQGTSDGSNDLEVELSDAQTAPRAEGQ